MTQEDQDRFPPLSITLRNGAAATIRALQPGDGSALGDFFEAVPRRDVRFYCPYPLTREQAGKNAAAAGSPCEVVLVLDQAGNGIGGYAWFRWQAGAERSTFGICIRPGLQGCGAGKALMTRLLEIARQVGPPVMGLTVQKANGRAVELYQKTGFCIIRDQVRGAFAEFPAEPEYFMERRAR